MSNTTIDAIRQAEKAAIEAEKAAEAKAQQALIAAKMSAGETVSSADENSKKLLDEKLAEAQTKANAYIDAEVKKADAELEQLRNKTFGKESEAVKAVISALIGA